MDSPPLYLPYLSGVTPDHRQFRFAAVVMMPVCWLVPKSVGSHITVLWHSCGSGILRFRIGVPLPVIQKDTYSRVLVTTIKFLTNPEPL